MESTSHARDEWLVISGDLGNSRRAEKGVKQTRFEVEPTLIKGPCQTICFTVTKGLQSDADRYY